MQRTFYAEAKKHIVQSEARIARVEALVAKLTRDNRPETAALGRAILAALRHSLNLAQATFRARGALLRQ